MANNQQSSTLTVIKILIIPALISLLLFLFLTYLFLPFYRRYRNVYSQYIPLDAITTHTSSFRARLTDRFLRFALPSNWRRDYERDHAEDGVTRGTGTSAADRGSEEGEELEALDDDTWRIIEQRTRMGGGTLPQDDSSRRLSRDLEEGFRDSSDEEQQGS